MGSFRSRKTESLLAYLAFYAGTPVAKEQLAEALWPEADGDRGRHSLRMAVSSIRSAMNRADWNSMEYVLSDRNTLVLTAESVKSDVALFREAIASGKESNSTLENIEAFSQACSLYRGPLLNGFTDDWILPQALELEELYAQTVSGLTCLLATNGDVQRAIAESRRALSLFPLREDLHVALMRVYAIAGESTAAIKQFEELEKMLDDHWGERPGRQAHEVMDSLPSGGDTSRTPRQPAQPAGPGAAPLPISRKPFFGREAELSTLRRLLAPSEKHACLITLVGLGGSGKTRLAERVAQDLQADFDGRVWFASFVGLHPDQAPGETVLSAFTQSPPQNADAAEYISKLIGEAPALLVLDNLEHVVAQTRTLTDALRQHCPNLRILATSRIPLDAKNEQLVPVAPLPLPNDYRDLNALRESPSVQLLVEAAQVVRPGFSVTSANAQSVLLLCRRLEGIPLAIELCAAKLATLTPAQVVASIGRRLDVSASRSELPDRHRSMESVVEWSINQLRPSIRVDFSKLGICSGGFTSELAAALTGTDPSESIQELTRCALIKWNETDLEVRFEILETVREKAREMLDIAPNEARETSERFFNYLHSLCSKYETLKTEDERRLWAQSLVNETNNLLEALEMCAEGLIPSDSAWRFAFSLRPFIERRARPQLWVGSLDKLLDATAEKLEAELLSEAHLLMARIRYGLRDIRATYEHIVQAMDAADRTNNLKLQILTRCELETPASLLGEYEFAIEALNEAIELLRKSPDDGLAARCHINLGWTVFDSGREADSREQFAKAVEFAERAGDSIVLSTALVGLACAVGATDYAESIKIFERAQFICDQHGVPERIGHMHYYRALNEYRNGKPAEALENIHRSFKSFVSHGIALGQTPLTVGGLVLAANGDLENALLCFRRAQWSRVRYGMQMFPTLAKDYERESASAGEDFNARVAQAPLHDDEELVEKLLIK